MAAVTAVTTGLLGQTVAGAQRGGANRDQLEAQGPCGNGGPKANRCKRNADCCTGYCDKNAGRVYGRCRCKRAGQACASNRQCCKGSTCRQGRCRRTPKPQRCRKAGRPCTTNRQCCPGKTGRICLDGRCRRRPVVACGDVCASGCAFTTVQAAIDAAAPGDTITLCAQTYTEDLAISEDLTIVGAGSGNGGTILQGTGTDSVVTLSGSPTIEFRDVMITGGATEGVGGGISNGTATLTLTRVNITGNSAGSRSGGIDVNTGGSVTLVDSQVTDNSAATFGGGIYSLGSVELQGTSVTTNTAGSDGGGIYISTGGSVTCSGTNDISGNTAGDPPGASDCEGTGCATCVV